MYSAVGFETATRVWQELRYILERTEPGPLSKYWNKSCNLLVQVGVAFNTRSIVSSWVFNLQTLPLGRMGELCKRVTTYLT